MRHVVRCLVAAACCSCSKSPVDCPDLGTTGWSAIAVDREIELFSIFDSSVVLGSTSIAGAVHIAVFLGAKPDSGAEVVVIDAVGARTLGAWDASALSSETTTVGFAGSWAPELDELGSHELLVIGAGRLTALSVETATILWRADVSYPASTAFAPALDGDDRNDVLVIDATGTRGRARVLSGRDGSLVEEIDFDIVTTADTPEGYLGIEEVVVDAISKTGFVVGSIRSAGAEAHEFVFARLQLEPLLLLSSFATPRVADECEAFGAWLSRDPAGTRLRVLTASALLELDPVDGRVASRQRLRSWRMDSNSAGGDAGDFDGDGRSEFWRASQTHQPGQPFSNGCRMAIHSGANGAVLWEDGSTRFVSVDVLRDDRGRPVAWIAGTTCPYGPLVRKPWPVLAR